LQTAKYCLHGKSPNENHKTKENIRLKKELGEQDDENCHPISFLIFYGLLGNLSAINVYCTLGGVNVKS
jgi:hypothetical protein